MPPVLRPPGTDPVARAQALLALSERLGDATSDVAVLRDQAVRALVELCGDTAVLWEVSGPADARVLAMSARWHDDPRARADLDRLGAPVRLREDRAGFLWAVATGDGPLLLPEVEPSDLGRVHDDYAAYFELWGLSSMVLVPLRARGNLLGALGVSRGAGGERYDESDLEFVTHVAVQIGLALDNALLVASVRRQLLASTEAEAAVRRMASHDPLTGLPNRTLLQVRLQQGLEAGPLALLLVDLDGFKEVNDGLGHAVGDRVLVAVGQRLRAALEPDLLLARLGGDEFAVLVPLRRRDDDVRRDDLPAVGRRLVDSLAAPVEVSGTSLRIGMSVGISWSPGGAGSEDEAGQLMREADVAMYRAKRERLGVATYEPALDSEAAERLERLNDLRRGLAERELVVHLQPVVSSADGALHHREALVRWQHPALGLLPPLDFVPLAEQAGLGLELSEVVLELALRAGGAVAVNVSPVVLADRRWVDHVLATLAAHRVAPGLLTLEVTESSAAQPAAIDSMRRLAAEGVRLALDDFGTGWSSLAVLRTLPVHQLKIDKSFVGGIDEDEPARALVATMVELGRLFGLQTVAEGVETAAVARVLRDLGADLQQGWLHGRPAPA